MAVSLQQLLVCIWMCSDRLCDFSWNKLCLTPRSALVQRLGEACVYVDPEGCAKALISLLRSCCFLYLLASAKSIHPHTCSLTLISQAHTQLSISSATLEIMKVPSPGPNILLISVELKYDVSNYSDVKKAFSNLVFNVLVIGWYKCSLEALQNCSVPLTFALIC